MCDITDTIDAPCGANPGGIAKVYIAAVGSVDVIPAATTATHSIDTDITMIATKKFHRVDNTAEVGEYNEALTGEIDAQFLNRVLTLTVPGMNQDNVAKFQGMLGGKFIAIVVYVDGQKRVIGDKTNPLKLRKSDHASGKAGGTDRRGHTFELYSPGANYAYFYTPALTTIVNE